MAPCDTPLVLDISLWESPRPERLTLFSIITGWVVVDMTSVMFSDSNLHTAMAHSWMWSTQMRCTAFGAICEISTLEKECWPGLDGHKWWPTIKLCQRVARSFLNICQGLCIDFDIYFRKLWGKTVELEGWFHTIGKQRITALYLKLNSTKVYVVQEYG